MIEPVLLLLLLFGDTVSNKSMDVNEMMTVLLKDKSIQWKIEDLHVDVASLSDVPEPDDGGSSPNGQNKPNQENISKTPKQQSSDLKVGGEKPRDSESSFFPVFLKISATIVLYLIMIVGVVLGVILMLSQIPEFELYLPKLKLNEFGRKPKSQEPQIEEGNQTLPQLPDYKKKLYAAVAEGRWEEAAHLLLLAVIHQLQYREGFYIADFETSRELTRKLPLSPKAMPAFKILVNRVERSYFGLKPFRREHYPECKSAYDKLSQLLNLVSL